MCLDFAERGEGVALGWARSVNQRIADGKLVRFTDLSLHIPDAISVYLRKQGGRHTIATRIIEEVRATIEPINPPL